MPFRKITRSDEAPQIVSPPSPALLVSPAPRRRWPPAAGAFGIGTSPDLSAETATEADRPYEVGYGKPPVRTRFRKGRSGNPKGRPAGARGLKKMIRDTLLAYVPVRTEGGTRRMTKIEAIIHKQLEQAVKGNQRAAIQLMNLYAAAVPDQADHGPEQASTLTETDEAIIGRFRAQILSDEGEAQ